MSSVRVFDRAYATIREMLLSGAFRPGEKLEAERLGKLAHVSMIPIREALSRLVGEGLVTATSGDGFFVPKVGKGSLTDLYRWHWYLASYGAAYAKWRLPRPDGEADYPSRVAALFIHLAGETTNGEFERAVRNASDRLHHVRPREVDFIPDHEAEISSLEAARDARNNSLLETEIRAYHRRRIRLVPALVAKLNS